MFLSWVFVDHHPEFGMLGPTRWSLNWSLMKSGSADWQAFIYDVSSHRSRFRRLSTSCRIRDVGKICPGSLCQLSGEARVRGLACLLHRFEGPRVTAGLLRRFEGLRGFPFRWGACLSPMALPRALENPFALRGSSSRIANLALSVRKEPLTSALMTPGKPMLCTRIWYS